MCFISQGSWVIEQHLHENIWAASDFLRMSCDKYQYAINLLSTYIDCLCIVDFRRQSSMISH